MICYVILHYQAIEETKTCINSIRANTKDAYKIIIVDNASPNKSGKELQREYKSSEDVIVVLNDANSGFAKGNNIGFKKAKSFCPDYIVVLNSDIELTSDDFVFKLENAYQRYNFDVLGPDRYSTQQGYHQNPQKDVNFTLKELKRIKIKLYWKNKLKWLLKIKYSLLKQSAEQKIVEKDFKNVQLGKILHGAFYVFSKKFIDTHTECFYPGTFMYYESYILSYLGDRENLTFLYYPDILVKHHEDASTNATYNDQYKKSVFINRCLLDSCEEFIKVMKDKTIKLG